MVQNGFREFQVPECQAETCPDGEPMSSVDYSPARCCAGTTPLCRDVDCAKCEASLGWCPHSPGRRRMGFPSDMLEVWED